MAITSNRREIAKDEPFFIDLEDAIRFATSRSSPTVLQETAQQTLVKQCRLFDAHSGSPLDPRPLEKPLLVDLEGQLQKSVHCRLLFSFEEVQFDFALVPRPGETCSVQCGHGVAAVLKLVQT